MNTQKIRDLIFHQIFTIHIISTPWTTRLTILSMAALLQLQPASTATAALPRMYVTYEAHYMCINLFVRCSSVYKKEIYFSLSFFSWGEK